MKDEREEGWKRWRRDEKKMKTFMTEKTLYILKIEHAIEKEEEHRTGKERGHKKYMITQEKYSGMDDTIEKEKKQAKRCLEELFQCSFPHYAAEILKVSFPRRR